MKKHSMTRALAAFACVSLLMFGGCSDSLEELEPDASAGLTVETRAKVSREDAVYHQQTQSWIYPQNDPYTLENFRNAYDNLLSNSSARSLSGVVTAKLASLQLEATHYSVKIYPKTEKEQRELEQMDDITVCYVPFDYAQLPESQTSGLNRANARVFPEEARYTVVHDDYITPEGPAEPETIIMPTLYVVWPCSKPFPADMGHEILYEVFLPDASAHDASDNLRSTGSGSDAMQLLEEEALRLAMGEPALSRGMPVIIYHKVNGSIHYTDNLMGKEVPIAHLKVRIQKGSKVTDLMTDSFGYYSNSAATPINASLSFVFETEYWRITEPDKLIPITIQKFSISGSNGHRWLERSELPIYEIHRALNYFYFTHVLDEEINPYKIGDIRVVALSSENASANGTFNYSRYDSPYINIYNNNRSNHSRVIGTVLHETGHYQQYRLQGYSKFVNSNKLLKESYASYVGWWEGNNYYKSLGYGGGYNDFFINNGTDLTGQSRQGWTKTLTGTSGYYSPLFVDLVDNYNQNTPTYPLRNYDMVRNVTMVHIIKLARDCSDWTSFKNVLRNPNIPYVPIDPEELARFIEPYDYFFAHQ